MNLSTAEPIIWSRSQSDTAKECRRKRFFQSHRFTSEGANGKPSLKESILYLRKMRNRHLWVNQLIHDTVADIVKKLRQESDILDCDKVLEDIKSKMRSEFRLSLNPEETGFRLFEHEYGLALSKDVWQRHWDQVEKSIRWFYQSNWLARLKMIEPHQWKVVDETMTFEVGENRAYARIDVAIEKNDQIFIIDWKSGAIKPDDEFGLNVTALYAHDVWGANPESIVATAVSLQTGQTHQAMINEETLMETQLRIESELGMLQECKTTDETNPFSLPMAVDKSRCRWCNFQKLCFPESHPATA